MLLTVALTVIAVPLRFRELSQPCDGPRCTDDNALLSPASAAVLNELGISLQQYAFGQIGLALAQVVIGWLLAVLLLRRGSPDGITLLVALNLSTGGFSNSLLNALPAALPWAAWLAAFILYVGYVSFMLVFYLFPDGRFVPGWTRWLVLILAVNELIYTVGTTLTLTQAVVVDLDWYWYDVLDGLIWLGSFVMVIATQLYRYYWVSGAVQRRQTRWVVFGLSVSLCFVVVLLGLGNALGWMGDPRYDLLLASVSPWFTLVIMVSLAIAILRYRLWDIDLLIRRTLVYSVLTGALALVYFSSVVLLQRIFASLTGQQQNEIVTVISTLAIAALFIPLRRRVQDVIDRRFYRKKYDAAKVIAEFGATCRDETDLDKLTARLVEVVDETMQPASVQLWLKDSNAKPALSVAEGTQRRKETKD